jgi:DNA-binding NtrC family response regulator
MHRLNTIEIYIPPLRSRLEDIEPLVEYFTANLASQMNLPKPEFSEAAIYKLKKYSFPGNVRELKNLIERAFILNKGKELRPEHFPLSASDDLNENTELIETGNLFLEEHEKKLILLALERSQYNQQKTADLLGISRHSLSRRLKKFELIANSES